MKLIYLLLTILFLNIYSAACAQRITYSGKNVPLKMVFAAIQKQTGYGFFYDQKILSGAKSVSVDFKNVSLNYVLSTICKGQALEFSIENKTILVSKKKPASQKNVEKPKVLTKHSAQKTSDIEPLPVKIVESEISYDVKTIKKPHREPDSLINPVNRDPAEYPKTAAAAGDNILPASKTTVSTLQISPQVNFEVSKGTRKKYLYLELGGGSIGLSANYDFRLKSGRNDGFGFRIGAGISRDFISVPIGINYILGKKRSGLEAGVEATPGLNIFGYGKLNHKYFPRQTLSFNAGYRLQSYNKFMLRANVQVIHLSRGDWVRIPGISVGYGLNRTQNK